MNFRPTLTKETHRQDYGQDTLMEGAWRRDGVND